MSKTELNWLPATELAALIRRKAVSPVEVVQSVLDHIETYEPGINALALPMPEQAKVSARAAEKAVMSGEAVGPLHGVPVTIKDLIPMKDLPMRAGSFIEENTVAPDDAPAVTRLEQAGAVVVGKTTTSEFGWTGVSRSPLTGLTHNPWKHGYNTGASSAGAGAAAAAGYGPLHLGSDGAGSVRMPAHFSGVFGLKPSFGRIPYYPVSLGDQTSHLGPLTRTVADAAAMMAVVSGPHPWDHMTLESPPADYVGRLHEPRRGLRIAFSADFGHARVDPELATLVRKAAETLAQAAEVELVDVTPSWGKTGPEIGRFFWTANLTRLQAALPKWEEKMDPGLVGSIKAGKNHTVADYQGMRAKKYAYIGEIHRFFEDWDLLLTPAVSVPAFPLPLLQPADWPQHEWDWLSWAEFSYPFNMAGNPAASVPCGFTQAGLPVGLQIVGRRFDDLSVLQASALFEAVRPWADKRPDLAQHLKA